MQLSSLAVLLQSQAKRGFAMLNQIAVLQRSVLGYSMILFYPSCCAIDLITCGENIIFMVNHVGRMPVLSVSPGASGHHQRYICHRHLSNKMMEIKFPTDISHKRFD